jgi:hypothetical protein
MSIVAIDPNLPSSELPGRKLLNLNHNARRANDPATVVTLYGQNIKTVDNAGT